MTIVYNIFNYINIIKMENEKIINPITKRYIYINGGTYYHLISSGQYTQEYLLSLPRLQSHKPMSPKYKKSINPTLPDDIILNELLMKLGLNEFITFCQTNQKYKTVCQNDLFWKQFYDRYYGHSNMEKSKKTYFEIVKLCYQLTLLINKLSLPFNINQLYHLQRLVLDNKKLRILPSEIGQLKQLQVLELNQNQLTDITALGQLQQLQGLGLSHNQITDISVLGQLKQLDSLYLNHNQLTDISTLGQCQQLQVLDLSYNQLTDISALYQCQQLIYLFVNQNQLTTIPIKILDSKTLLQIVIDKNVYDNLPSKYKKLKNYILVK